MQIEAGRLRDVNLWGLSARSSFVRIGVETGGPCSDLALNLSCASHRGQLSQTYRAYHGRWSLAQTERRMCNQIIVFRTRHTTYSHILFLSKIIRAAARGTAAHRQTRPHRHPRGFRASLQGGLTLSRRRTCTNPRHPPPERHRGHVRLH